MFSALKFGKNFLRPSKSSIPIWQYGPERSHAMKDDTTRYPRTMVVFAIVMLGTGVERYALPVLLSLSVASFCSMKIISTIGYVVGLTMAAVVGDCMRRNTSFLSCLKTACPFSNSAVQAFIPRSVTHSASGSLARYCNSWCHLWIHSTIECPSDLLSLWFLAAACIPPISA